VINKNQEEQRGDLIEYFKQIGAVINFLFEKTTHSLLEFL
jgi:hypothetical protein